MDQYIKKQEEKLIKLFSLNKKTNSQKSFYDIAILVNLFYEEDIEYYIEFLRHVPQKIDLYIISSNSRILRSAENLLNRRNIYFLEKDNRGRDLSALLVAFYPYFEKYDKICFLHDKKHKSDQNRKETQKWIENLWSNMIGSEAYIENVISYMESNKEVGLLVPPEPYGDFLPAWYSDTWTVNFELCKTLCDRLGLNIKLDKDIPVSTLGSVFWARTDALKKLFDVCWKYEDFPEEPMPIDGTISHAIERCLSFVAQDKGYKTVTIMTDEYASWLLSQAQKDMRYLFSQVAEEKYSYNMHQIRDFDDRYAKLEQFVKDNKKVYIYGAGNYGKNIYKLFCDSAWKCEGFVVSNGHRKANTIEGLDVFELDEVLKIRDIGIVIAVSYETQKDIIDMLISLGINNYICAY